MNPISTVNTSYNLTLVALSFGIAVLGSFVALIAARRIIQPNGSLNLLNCLSAGVALGGVGVWTMHFVGMHALKMDVATGFGLVEMMVSLVAAIAASALALAFVAKNPKSTARLVGAGTLLGIGVAFMHYLGMLGIQFGGYIGWSYSLVAASLFIAIVAATAALWLAFNTASLSLRFVAAFVMGVAVCAMHYTGMEAAQFICTTVNRTIIPIGFAIITASELPVLVTVVAICLSLLIMVDQFSQRAFGR